MSSSDTIYALASGRLPAGIAIVRISGELSTRACLALCGCIPAERVATYVAVRDEAGGVLDRALALYLPKPATFTGEDVIELHLHGSRAVVASVYARLGAMQGLRPADAGEFSRRAFLNGKMNLTQAEAFADLIEAETESQRRLAMANADGAQSRLYGTWRETLLHATAMIEAELDYPDEEDVAGNVSDQIWQGIRELSQEMRGHVAGFKRCEMIRDGYDVVITGPPNAGKSSLLNALLARDAAIVSPEPGTTRDLVEAVLDIDGYKVRVTDTAGLRDGAGAVEEIGIRKARQRIAFADLVVEAIDLSLPEQPGQTQNEALSVRIGTKADNAVYDHKVDLSTSAETGTGIAELLSLIGSRAAEAAGNITDILPSRARHVEEIASAATNLEWAVRNPAHALELRAEALRQASQSLAKIVGLIDTEEVLGTIFSRFCIGK